MIFDLQKATVLFTRVVICAGAFLGSPYLSAYAQKGTSSPYSRYGIGELSPAAYSKYRALGGTGYGISDERVINFMNPASYSFIRNTTFEPAAETKITKLSSTQYQRVVNNTSFAYLALAFPVSKRWGTSVGLLPFSHTGYDVSQKEAVSNVGDVQYFYEGSGSLSRFYLGNACKISKNFSFGANASYLFGSFSKTRKTEFPGSSNVFNSRIISSTTAGDLTFDAGALYTASLKNEIVFTAGLVLSPGTRIRTHSDTVAERYLYNTYGYAYVKDTVLNIADKKGDLTLPAATGLGITLHKGGQWLVAVDAHFRDWSHYAGPDGKNDSLGKSLRIALGGQMTPDPEDIHRYLKRVDYRLGLRYELTPYRIGNTQIKETALTTGLGLPLRKALSVINISAEFVQRGTTSAGLVKEQFVRGTIGITINDIWFLKNKFD